MCKSFGFNQVKVNVCSVICLHGLTDNEIKTRWPEVDFRLTCRPFLASAGYNDGFRVFEAFNTKNGCI